MPARYLVQKKGGRRDADVESRLADRSQRRFDDGGIRGFGESCHCDVLRNTDTMVFQEFHGADGDRIRDSEKSVRKRIHLQELHGADITRLHLEPGFDDQAFVHRQPVLFQRAYVPVPTLYGDGKISVAGEMGNPPASLADKVFRGEKGPLPVIHYDFRGPDILGHPVEKHQRHIVFQQTVIYGGVVRILGDRNQDAVHHIVLEELQIVLLDGSRLVRLGHKDIVPFREKHPLHPDKDLGEIGIDEFRDHHSHSPCLPAAESQGYGIRTVVQPLGHLQHGPAGIRIHVPLVSQGSGYRGCRYVQFMCYVLYGGPFRHLSCALWRNIIKKT